MSASLRGSVRQRIGPMRWDAGISEIVSSSVCHIYTLNLNDLKISKNPNSHYDPPPSTDLNIPPSAFWIYQIFSNLINKKHFREEYAFNLWIKN